MKTGFWIEKYLGWCPLTKAYSTGKSAGNAGVSVNFTGGRDADMWWFIRPATILLLPLIPAMIFLSYSHIVPIILPSMELQTVIRILWIGIPVAVLIRYGRSTRDRLVTVLAGALLFPLFEIYSQILGFPVDPGFYMTSPVHWPILFITTSPFMLLLGATGFFASGRTKTSLLAACILGFLVVVIILGIG